jgi:outer membrane protein, heavy metal efflux system
MRIAWVIATALAACAPACAPSHDATLGDVRAWVAEHRGRPEAAGAVAERLRAPLDAEAAAGIAILQNRELQAELEELGVWEAELWASRLLPNPTLAGGVFLPAHPSEPGAGTKIDGSLTIDVVRLLILGPRTSAASSRLEAEKMKAADRAWLLALEVKRAFFSLVALEEMREAQARGAEAADAAARFADRQHEAGNASELEASHHRVALKEASLELARLELLRIEARTRFAKMLGVPELADELEIVRPLPELPRAEAKLEGALEIASSRRLDLAAARAEIEAFDRAATVAAWQRIPELRAGAGLVREIDGHLVIGPALQVGLPIFDRNQAEIARVDAHARAAKQRLAEREQQVRSDVAAAVARLSAARKAVEYYRDEVLPLRARIVDLSQRQYNQMQLGVFELLRAKKSETEARRQAIEALRDYWHARVDVEHAIGGALESPKPKEG